MTTRKTRDPAPPNTCGTCTATWTGTTRCHCAAPGCHRTFAGVRLFDTHRSHYGEHGHCIDPATLRFQSGPNTGEPVMHLRDGIWSSPEMPEDVKLARFGRT
jgi:hypothetical protein